MEHIGNIVEYAATSCMTTWASCFIVHGLEGAGIMKFAYGKEKHDLLVICVLVALNAFILFSHV